MLDVLFERGRHRFSLGVVPTNKPDLFDELLVDCKICCLVWDDYTFTDVRGAKTGQNKTGDGFPSPA